MSIPRTKCLSTKLTDDEYAELERAAGTQTLSTWARDVLLQAARRAPAGAVVVAEVLALRTILLNLHYAHFAGDAVTSERMQQLIARADRDRFARADRARRGGSRQGWPMRLWEARGRVDLGPPRRPSRVASCWRRRCWLAWRRGLSLCGRLDAAAADYLVTYMRSARSVRPAGSSRCCTGRSSGAVGWRSTRSSSRSRTRPARRRSPCPTMRSRPGRRASSGVGNAPPMPRSIASCAAGSTATGTRRPSHAAVWTALVLFLGGVIGVRTHGVVDARWARDLSSRWDTRPPTRPVVIDHVGSRSPARSSSLAVTHRPSPPGNSGDPGTASGADARVGGQIRGRAIRLAAHRTSWPDPYFQ